MASARSLSSLHHMCQPAYALVMLMGNGASAGTWCLDPLGAGAPRGADAGAWSGASRGLSGHFVRLTAFKPAGHQGCTLKQNDTQQAHGSEDRSQGALQGGLAQPGRCQHHCKAALSASINGQQGLHMQHTCIMVHAHRGRNGFQRGALTQYCHKVMAYADAASCHQVCKLMALQFFLTELSPMSFIPSAAAPCTALSRSVPHAQPCSHTMQDGLRLLLIGAADKV